uniref:Uncharacterized protein n=1 Tax=Glossina brevipalpis TaxID=37001 RepID=A0A1A9WIJ1_9MUSC
MKIRSSMEIFNMITYIVITGVVGISCPVQVANSGPCQLFIRGTIYCNHSALAELLQSTTNQPGLSISSANAFCKSSNSLFVNNRLGYDFAMIATCNSVALIIVSFSALKMNQKN